MYIICCGMYRSCSTWQYQVACELAEKRDGQRLGFIESAEFFTNHDFQQDIQQSLLFKAHGFQALYGTWLQSSQAKAIYSYRDIRDVTISLMHKMTLTFDQIIVEDGPLLDALESYYKWISMPNILIQRYEDIVNDSYTAIREISDHLGYSVNDTEITEITEKFSIESNRKRSDLLKEELIKQNIALDRPENTLVYDKYTLLHWNHVRNGSKKDWRNVFTPQELIRLEPVVGRWLIETGYEQDDYWAFRSLKPSSNYARQSHYRESNTEMESNSSTTLDPTQNQWLNPVQIGTSTLMNIGSQISTIGKVIDILRKISPDEYIEFMINYYQKGLERFGEHWKYVDQLTILYASSEVLNPQKYLEIGVFRGRSMSVVASVAPDCDMYGFDLWVENYSGLQNTGSSFVQSQLNRVEHRGNVTWTPGNSNETIPLFFHENPDLFFDLITVDGDHSEEGARIDLENVLPRVKVGGVLVFDDIRHPKHPWLERVWDEVVGANPNFLAAKYTEVGHGVAFAIRRDTNLKLDALRGTTEMRIRQLSSRFEEAQAEISELQEQLALAEVDRAARLEIIERQGAELSCIPTLEADIAYLKTELARSEADRTARLEFIERQGAELDRIPALEADVAYLKAQIARAEADRAGRLAVIERQGAELGQLQHTLAQTLQRMESVHNLLGANKLKYMGVILSARWEQIQQLLQPPISSVSTNNHVPSPGAAPGPIEHRPLDEPERPDLEAYIATISEFNSTQTNAAFLDSIRLYNHTTIETLDSLRPLHNKHLLDIGASPHGYALERALALGVAEYVGVGLDVEQSIEVQSDTGRGRLLYMNAEQLDFTDHSFDLVMSLSTFEHVGDVPRVLAEIKRVLKPGGSALISFEPIWTCSYGHHLHHFGPIAAHMPDWAHLLWDENRMRAELAAIWPADGIISLDEAVAWTYKSPAINRIGITQMRAYFEQSGLATEWMVLLPDEPRDSDRLQFIAEATALSPTDLMTKGLSVLLNNVEGDS